MCDKTLKDKNNHDSVFQVARMYTETWIIIWEKQSLPAMSYRHLRAWAD